MRIRSQLFLGMGIVVLTLTGVQWFLHVRQLGRLERELGKMAAEVGEAVLFGRFYDGTAREGSEPLVADSGRTMRALWWLSQSEGIESAGNGDSMSRRERNDGNERKTGHSERVELVDVLVLNDAETAALLQAMKRKKERIARLEENVYFIGTSPIANEPVAGSDSTAPADRDHADQVRTSDELIRKLGQIEMRVIRERGAGENRLIIQGAPGGDRQVQIPIARSLKVVTDTMRQGLLAGGALLGLGLLAAALISHRFTKPLRLLSSGVEAIGNGRFGTRIEGSTGGELGELRATFNTMSIRLAQLEREKEQWRTRERFAELGFLARGLAHSLRNPLNTLGLIVDEMAVGETGDTTELAEMSRAQLKRIDRWLKSFLALGAGDRAESRVMTVQEAVQDVILELSQAGAVIQYTDDSSILRVRAIPSVLRSALSNLVTNAVEASPTDVEVSIGREGTDAVIRISDKGPGLPDSVRENLFKPHVTTKTDGSGMGLYLARQLVEGALNGRLLLMDAPAGGVIAEIRLNLVENAVETMDE
ncbi:HAMP domain-containing histidine kinase [bacterium]|nr:HAMP domain-containing histidine kinase [candidate division CSSED10-310 bacterium]